MAASEIHCALNVPGHDGGSQNVCICSFCESLFGVQDDIGDRTPSPCSVYLMYQHNAAEAHPDPAGQQKEPSQSCFSYQTAF